MPQGKARPRPTKEIGDRLREMRIKAKMCQIDVARRMNVSAVFVSSTELGYRPEISDPELDLFARAMGYDGFPEGGVIPNPNKAPDIGAQVKAILATHSLTPEQLAKRLRVRYQIVNGWLSGEPIARAHRKLLEEFGHQDWRQPAPTKVTKTTDKGPLGLMIIQLRKEQGLSLRALADRMQYSFQLIHLIETGAHCPTYVFLLELARALDCSEEGVLSDLIAAAQEEHPKFSCSV